MHRRTLGPHFSEGSRLMWLRLKALEWTAEDLTRAANWNRGRSIRYLYGDRSPDRDACVQIKEILGIEAAEFSKPPKRAFAPPAARAA